MNVLIVRTFPDVLQLNSYNVQEIGLAKALLCNGVGCGVVLYHADNPDKTETFHFERQGKKYSFPIYWLRGYNFLKNGLMPSIKEIIPKYDVIQVHEYDQILSWKLYTKMKKPTLIYHGPYYHEYAKGYNLKCKVFDTFFLNRRKHDRVVTLTKSELASDFLRAKGFKFVQTVGVGIDKDNFEKDETEQIRTILERDDSKMRILYVGKIEERRNVYFLIELFESLLKSHDNLELVIVGDGEKEYAANFLKRIDDGIQRGKIRYFRKATQKELARVYQNADLFLFTSNYEIFGMVLLEALYFGLPVVSSMNGGASVLIQNGINGYTLDSFHVEKWKKRVEDIICDEQSLVRMKTAAHEMIEKNFLWDELAGQFIEGYHKAIELFEKE